MVTQTLTDEYTTAALKTNTVAALPAYDDDWNDTAGSFANLSSDELSYSIRESRYHLRFKIPLVNTGLNYRAFWVERFIPEAGVALDAPTVYSPGVYRPTVTVAAPPVGGIRAQVVAVMGTSGSADSYLILNPGLGYLVAPAITVASAINSGTTATATGTINALGQLIAVTPGVAGNYLPTGTLSAPGGGGTIATIAFTLDPRGGIATATHPVAGSLYTAAPTLTVTPKVAGTTPADIQLHLGTETPRCAVWDGVTPPGYDSETPSTYPIIGDGVNPYFELPVPPADGTTLVANLRAVCDGSPCP